MIYTISFNVSISVTMILSENFNRLFITDFYLITEMEDSIDKLWLKGLLRVTINNN